MLLSVCAFDGVATADEGKSVPYAVVKAPDVRPALLFVASPKCRLIVLGWNCTDCRVAALAVASC